MFSFYLSSGYVGESMDGGGLQEFLDYLHGDSGIYLKQIFVYQGSYVSRAMVMAPPIQDATHPLII